tara:strand:+ start:431 stop:1153 length:723 start_codon:yes stop_codon:yes gene_type:complete
MQAFLSIIIPAYNEETRLKNTLPNLKVFLEGLSFRWEIIIVDDGSVDGTTDFARKYFNGSLCRVIVNKVNRGKGYSVKRGVLAAEGELILISDADFSTPLNDFYKLKAALDNGSDIAIGSRSLPDSNVVVPQAIVRESIGRTFNWFVNLIVLGGFVDTQCGFKLFPAKVAKPLFQKMTVDRFCFDVEFLYLARQAGLKIAEVPVEWYNVQESRVRILFDSPDMLADLFRIRLNNWLGKYR